MEFKKAVADCQVCRVNLGKENLCGKRSRKEERLSFSKYTLCLWLFVKLGI